MLKQIFSDDRNNLSSMRIMAFLALLVAAAYVLVPMAVSVKCETDPMVVIWFLTAAFGGKTFQKMAEARQT